MTDIFAKNMSFKFKFQIISNIAFKFRYKYALVFISRAVLMLKYINLQYL